MLRLLRQLLNDRRGGTAIEYGLIVALIVITIITAIQMLAHTTTGMWNDIGSQVANAR